MLSLKCSSCLKHAARLPLHGLSVIFACCLSLLLSSMKRDTQRYWPPSNIRYIQPVDIAVELGMAGKINWDEHRAQFEALKASEGISPGEYAKRAGLSRSAVYRNLVNEPQLPQPLPKPKAGRKAPATEKELALRELLKSDDLESLGEYQLRQMDAAFRQYEHAQRGNLDYLKRACDSFDGLIPFDDERYIEPEFDKDERPISPHKDHAAAAKEFHAILQAGGKNIISSALNHERRRALKIAAIREEIDRERDDTKEQIKQEALTIALARFEAKEDNWSAKKAAIYIEAAGGTVPHSIKAQLALDLAHDADDEGEPITEEALDAMCDAAAVRQDTWAKEVAERRAAVAEMVAREREDNADNDAEIILSADPTEIDDASFDDDCVVVGGGVNNGD